MSDDFDLQHYLDSGGSENTPQPTFDLQSYLDSGGEHGKDSVMPAKLPSFNAQDTKAGAEGLLSDASGIGAKIVGGYAGIGQSLKNLVSPGMSAADREKQVESALTYEPDTQKSPEAQAFHEKYGQGGWGSGLPKLAESAGTAVNNATGSPLAATAADMVVNAAPGLLAGARFADAPASIVPAATTDDSLSAARTQGAAVQHEQYDSPPIAGGVDKATIPDRQAVLQRIGLDRARNSAIEGNALNAGSDANVAKFDEPAGQAAKAQFEAEKTALGNHAESIVRDVGGTVGTDEDALNIRGQNIAQPFDKLRDWFKQQTASDYNLTRAKFGEDPVGNMENTDALLKDPEFSETLLGKGQENLLSAIQKKFQRFRDLNPGGWNVNTAETFRKSLNQMWTPENSHALGEVKNALDNDVVQNAGDDVFGPARQRVILQHKLLDNPNGVTSLFDTNPNTPINRATPYEKIPDKLTRLSVDQFKNVIDTLKQMPEEIQPDAQRAISEIQSHLANKLIDSGNKFKGAWNDRGVTATLKSNGAKFESAFQDNPEVLQKIQDLDAAGKILSADHSYKGAAAQASAAVKRGLMTTAISKVGGPIGGAIGGMVAGPPGAMGGAAIGEGIARRGAGSLGERQALKAWQARTTPLNEVLGTTKPAP